MTDPSNQSGGNMPVKKPDDSGMALIVYILYLVACVFGITSIIGVIMAYIQKNDAPAWVQSHYQFQIRTFWIVFIGSIIGALLAMVVIGFFLLAALGIWYIIRCIKGLMWLQAGQPVPDPTSWLFGTAKST